MDFEAIYHILFETYAGIGILVGTGLVLSIIACIILERKTRKVYHNHEAPPDDEWSIFEDEVEEAEAEETKKLKRKKNS